MPPFPRLDPPLLNSACLWASTLADIEAIYTSPHAGAVTTRTACHPIQKFPEDASKHQHAFSSSSRGILPNPQPSSPELNTTHPMPGPRRELSDVSSLNTYGYAPHGLAQYVYMAKDLERKYPDLDKPIIFSVTGDSETVAACWKLLTEYHHPSRTWCMEINLSCPNIAGKPPPAYSKQQLIQFLAELREHISKHILSYTEDLDTETENREDEWAARLMLCKIPIGIKLPPYTYAGQFDDVVSVISDLNGDGFGMLIWDTETDPSGAGARPGAGSVGMTERSIDPTLLSSFDVDNFVSELSDDMANRLSLENALNQSVTAAPELEDKSFAAAFRKLLKTPLGQFISSEVFGPPWPISFVTSTNTLGSSLLMEEDAVGWSPALNSADGSGIGGLAGAALHPLALGNVANLSKRLRRKPSREDDVKIIGVGGVCDRDGFDRMIMVGADAVGLATALGARGVAIFEDIRSKE